jgi:hypothetical protein
LVVGIAEDGDWELKKAMVWEDVAEKSKMF